VLTHAHLDPTGRLPLLARFDYSGNWLGSLAPARPRVILTHGEDGPRKALKARIHDRFNLRAEMPAYREVIEC
jgi:predicted metal-dependent RNase